MNSVIKQTPNDYIYVQVENGGGYFAQFSISYYFHGNYYEYTSGDLSLGFSEKIDIPGIVQRLYLKIKVWLNPFNHIVYYGPIRNYLPSCFYLYGTIFNPVCVQVPCYSIESTPLFNNSNCCYNRGCCNNTYPNCANNICANN